MARPWRSERLEFFYELHFEVRGADQASPGKYYCSLQVYTFFSLKQLFNQIKVLEWGERELLFLFLLLDFLKID